MQDGTGPKFRLRGWRGGGPAAFERLSDDQTGLRALTAGPGGDRRGFTGAFARAAVGR